MDAEAYDQSYKGGDELPTRVVTRAPVVIGIDDGVFASRQGYSAEGAAVAQQPVQKHRRDNNRLQPTRKPQCDVDLDLSPPKGYQISRIK